MVQIAGTTQSPATACASVLQRSYSGRRGLWSSIGWWNSANALTALIDYMSVTGDRSYHFVIERTFLLAPGLRLRRRFINKYFDDSAWWGLAWAAAYELTSKRRYLRKAEAIFQYLTTGWDDTFGGGLWWNTDRTYKNAITNELFGLLAVRLYSFTERRDYLTWAQREWEWFAASGLINSSGLINDGLNSAGANNGGTTWTYNQGVVLGFLAGLHTATGSGDCLSVGSTVARAAMTSLTTDGILTEPGAASGDHVQFKGIFIRNLRALAAVADLPEYREFILANAASAWDNARDSAGHVGYHWQGPFDAADAARQSSALDLLTAAQALTPPHP
jgi:predicted alpha-1,6-mannanase (GH76 family)